MTGRLVLSSDSILETGSVSWEVQNKVRDACAFFWIVYYIKVNINSLKARFLSRLLSVFLKEQMGKACKFFKQFSIYSFQKQPDINQEQRKTYIFPWMDI